MERCWYLFFVTMVSFLFSSGCESHRKDQQNIQTLRAQLAYPIYSLDPRIYDDWSSVFVANHIFPRLLPVEGKPWVTSVARDLKLERVRSSNRQVKFWTRASFRVAPFNDCSGNIVSEEQIRQEFFTILKSKPWIFPGWKSCTQKSRDICIEFPGQLDVNRRFESIYFRFGWSHVKQSDDKIGGGSYCLSGIRRSNDAIIGGMIAPREVNHLSGVELIVSQEPANSFHFALQGTQGLLKGDRKNVQPHTPLPYYVVTNPDLSGIWLPWNAEDTSQIIKSHLLNTGMMYEAPSSLLMAVPEGLALKKNKLLIRKSGSIRADFYLPDYLPRCEELSESINRYWIRYKLPHVKAKCGNLVELIEKRIRAPAKVSASRWGGFLISISPGSPERRSIVDQYFSGNSPESLTGRARKSEDFYYRIGMGQSLVTVDNHVLCGVAPTSLGLGDLTADDFIRCSGRLR